MATDTQMDTKPAGLAELDEEYDPATLLKLEGELANLDEKAEEPPKKRRKKS